MEGCPTPDWALSRRNKCWFIRKMEYLEDPIKYWVRTKRDKGNKTNFLVEVYHSYPPYKIVNTDFSKSYGMFWGKARVCEEVHKLLMIGCERVAPT